MNYPDLLTKAGSIRGGDCKAATDLLNDITVALDTEALSTEERRRLYKLRKKWTSRANQTDERWMALGSRPGRTTGVLKTEQRKRLAEERDPLLASILRKFGTPLPEDV